MLPFDRKPWAKTVARCVILISIITVVLGELYMDSQAPLDAPEILIGLLLLVAVIPPNLAIIFRKPGAEPRHSRTSFLTQRP